MKPGGSDRHFCHRHLDSQIGNNKGLSLTACVRAYVHCLCRPEHKETASLLRTTVPDFSRSSSLVTASPTSASSHTKIPFLTNNHRLHWVPDGRRQRPAVVSPHRL